MTESARGQFVDCGGSQKEIRNSNGFSKSRSRSSVALREERSPTLWNLPLRAFERLTESAQFTPPRDLLTTLAYVAFTVVGVDAAKSHLPWNGLSAERRSASSANSLKSTFDPTADFTSLRSTSTPSAESISKIDDWLTRELKRAAESVDLQDSLGKRFLNGLDSQEFRQRIESRIAESLKSEEIVDLIRQHISPPAETKLPVIAGPELLAQMDELIAKRIETALRESPELKQLSDSITNQMLLEKLKEHLGLKVEQSVSGVELAPGIESALFKIMSQPEFAEKLTAPLLKVVESVQKSEAALMTAAAAIASPVVPTPTASSLPGNPEPESPASVVIQVENPPASGMPIPAVASPVADPLPTTSPPPVESLPEAEPASALQPANVVAVEPPPPGNEPLPPTEPAGTTGTQP